MAMPTTDSLPISSRRETSILYLCMIVLVAAVGGFLFGYELQLISGAIIFLAKDFGLSGEGFWYGAVMGSAILGCPFGPLAGIWIADKFGRRKTLILSSVVFFVSAVGCAYAPNMIQFIFWRFVSGLAIGLAATVSPMYIAEVAPARLRGLMVLVNQLAIVIGCTLSALAVLWLSHGEHWRWMFASQAIPVLCLMIGLWFVPESPRWLAMAGRDALALGVLARINGQSQAEKELGEIRAELGDEEGTFAELLQPGVRRALIIGIGVMVFSQICGATIIHFYAPTLFVETGIAKEAEAVMNNVYMACWVTICTVMAFGLAHAFGRRPIILWGSAAMALGHLLVYVCFAYHASAQLTLLAMMFTSASFVLALAPLSWVVLSEIFPNRVRGKAMSLATAAMFALSYIAVQAFSPLMKWFKALYGHPGGTFLIFMVICVIGTAFVWRMLPETKDKTLEEIGEFWLKDRREGTGESA